MKDCVDIFCHGCSRFDPSVRCDCTEDDVLKYSAYQGFHDI
jgi:hypothetical protein